MPVPRRAASFHIQVAKEVIRVATAQTMTSQETIATFNQYVIPNYKRFPISLVRGEGAYVWDAEGNRYLDFFPGWGCNLLGHCPPRVVEAVRDQVGQLIHVPNTWYTEPQGLAAQALSERSFGGQCFFCNSGTEAVEAAIKLARVHTPKGRYKFISCENGFHGRTFGALTATAQPKYHEGFEPLLAGFTYVPYNDVDAVRRAIDNETCAVLVEPIQGEGGVNIPDAEYLPALRRLCDEHGILLVLDEVQTCMGRTGKWFGYQLSDVVPDIITLAKALAGGIACGAIIARPEVAASLKPGMHASTFGGNPIAARAALATIETIEADGLLEHTAQLADRFRQHFARLQSECRLVKQVRVQGVMIGIDLNVDGMPAVAACMQRRLLVNCTHSTVIRLLPPMNLTFDQCDEGCEIVSEVIKELA
jgi:predicted acetylornithine/succinylornithine family transaminase